MSPPKRSGAPPGKDARRPQSPATSRTTNGLRVTDRTDETAELARLTEQAARLVDEIGDQAARDEATYRRGWRRGWHDAARLFFEHGVDVGRAQADHEMQEAWSAIAERARASAKVPTQDELRERNHPDRTAGEIRKLMGRDKYPLPDRECPYCSGRGRFPGGA